MNAIRMAAALGAFALFCPTAQAQGLLSQLFNLASPQTRYNAYSVPNRASQTCTPCTGNACQLPYGNSEIVSPMILRNPGTSRPYFPAAPGNAFPGIGLTGWNRNQTPGSSYNGQNGNLFRNMPSQSGSGFLNDRPSRVLEPSFDVRAIPQRTPQNFRWGSTPPLFTGVSTYPATPLNSLPAQSNGWMLQ